MYKSIIYIIDFIEEKITMLEQLKQIILDNQSIPLKTGMPRNLKIEIIPGKATVCIGVRRCGKSTYMSQIMQHLLDSGVNRSNILHIDFFDNRLHNLHHENLEQILEAYYSLFPEKKNTEKIYCFFDEIQVIDHWELFINRLLRAEECEVYITGSSAKMLSKEIATQMRGRSLAWEMFPFSFYEFLKFHKIDSTPLSTKQRLLVNKYFEMYLISGGFPEVAAINQNLRIKIHQEYFNTILFRDLIERHDIKHPKAVIDLAQFLMHNVSSRHSIKSLYRYLKSLQYSISPSTIAQYLDWFEDAYFLFQVYIYDASLKRAKVNDKKIYCIDHALITSVVSGILVNAGHLLESMVYVALRHFTDKIFYYRTKSGKEVDFIIIFNIKNRHLIQVCESLTEPKTMQREINALNEAMGELNQKVGTVVTKTEERKISVDNGTIYVIPAWKFLLQENVVYSE